VSRKINVRSTNFVSLDVEADRYGHSDYEYYGEETENIPSVGDEYDYYGSDEGDNPASLLLDHTDGNDAWSDEPDSSLAIEEKHQSLHSEIRSGYSSHQKTRLRGSDSRSNYVSAISVGDGRPTCREHTNFPNRCRARSDCRLVSHGIRAWCVDRRLS
jgi:hypothetical protein